MLRTIFLDLDDTLLDFGAAEAVAIRRALAQLGVEPTQAVVERYRELNLQQWEAYERGEISRDFVLIHRFALLFQELGLSLDAQNAEDIYRGYLGVGHYFVEGAVALLEALYRDYDLYIASNGVAATQDSRLQSAGISKYFKAIFISETTGSYKPQKAYFDYCFARIPNFRPQEAVIVGDSLTSDILGGKNAGIRTCWFNPQRRPCKNGIVPDYEIHSLQELPPLLRTL